VIDGARRLIALGRPPAWTLIVVPLTILATSSLSVLPPLFIGRMIDGLTRRDFASVIHQLTLYALVTAGFGIAQLADGYTTSVFRETLTRNLRAALVRKLDRVCFDALSARTPGELSNRVTSDVQSLSVQFEYTFFPTLLSLCTLVATVAAMARVDLRLAAVAIGFALLTLLPLRVSAPRIAGMHRRQSEAADELNGYLQEGATLGGLALLRNKRASERRFERFAGIVERIFKLGIAQTVVSETTGLASSLVNMLGPAAIMAIGAYLVARGQMTPGTIVTMLIYQARMAAPFNTLSSMQVMMATIAVVTKRLLDIVDLPEERSGTLPFAPGRVAISNVTLERDGRAILCDASLAIERGEHVALVGASGSGKSTLAALLLRLYDPPQGSIAIAGTDLRDFALPSLRESVALVFQDPLVFDASLLENLTLTNPGASPAEIDAALEMCGLADVVERLRSGVDSRLGQRGFRLSGGERQRLCLARAVLQQPQLLILDEALSGVDIEAERAILRRLRAHLRDRTLVTITHRLDSVLDFDRIVTMEEGRIILERSGAVA